MNTSVEHNVTLPEVTLPETDSKLNKSRLAALVAAAATTVVAVVGPEFTQYRQPFEADQCADGHVSEGMGGTDIVNDALSQIPDAEIDNSQRHNLGIQVSRKFNGAIPLGATAKICVDLDQNKAVVRKTS